MAAAIDPKHSIRLMAEPPTPRRRRRHWYVQNFSIDVPDRKKTYSVWNNIVRTQKKS